MRPALIAVLLAISAAVSAGEEPRPALVLFLLGDAGAPDPAGEPVLAALARQVAVDPERSVVVFLGDNVYPAGVPDAASPRRAEAERRLSVQLLAAREASRTIVLPGNHDWEDGGPGGWDAVRREEALVGRAARTVYVPGGGCPGPVTLDVGASLRLVALDTQWWLHPGPKPGPGSGCAEATEDAVVAALRASLSGAGTRRVAVVAHHTLLSGGGHGGHFTVLQHLFPFREFADWLWVPIPILGSAYPAARMSGVSPQDVSSAAYGHMLATLRPVLASARPLFWASGHEHNVQVLDGRALGPRTLLVAGGGIYGKTSPVSRIPETRHASTEAGFLRVLLFPDGRTTVAAFAAARDGTARERWSGPLD